MYTSHQEATSAEVLLITQQKNELEARFL